MGAYVVGFVNDAAAQQPTPYAVDGVAGEPGVLGRDQPVGEDLTRIAAGDEAGRGSIGEGSDRPGGLSYWGEVDDLLFPLGGFLVADLGEETGHGGEAFGGPVFGAHAHKREGDGLRDGGRFLALHGAVEIDRRVAEIAAAGGQKIADEAVVGLVVADGGADPVVIGLGGVGPEVDGELGLDAQQVTPLHGPIVGELGAVQKAVDEGGALGGGGVGEKVGSFLGGGQGADDVEEGAAEEDGVGREVGGGNVEAFEAVEDAGVDGGPGGQGGGALEGWIERAVGGGGCDGQADRE